MNWPEAFFLTERLEDFEDAMLHGEENAVLGGLFAECLALAKAQATALTATEARIAEMEAENARLREAFRIAEIDAETIRIVLIDRLEEPDRTAFWTAVRVRDTARAALNPGDPK